jgi:RNA polymerase sigma-70 factor (ECF subfamily)
MGHAVERRLKRARDGQEAAFLDLFDEQHLPLFRFAYRLTGSVTDAEDIVQECFLGLLQPHNGFDPSRTQLRTYLFGAVRNQAYKRLRNREDTGIPFRAPLVRLSPEAEAFQAELESRVAQAVMQLPETQREVLILEHYEQMPLAEIAEILEIEVAAVKSRLQRARITLREALAAYAPGAERSR